jgi:hypothetical protein
MSDEELRARERRFHDTGSIEDEAELIRARERAGVPTGAALDSELLLDRLMQVVSLCEPREQGRALSLLGLVTGTEWVHPGHGDWPWASAAAASLSKGSEAGWAGDGESGNARLTLPQAILEIPWATYRNASSEARFGALILGGAPMRMLEARVEDRTSSAGRQVHARLTWNTTRICCGALLDLPLEWRQATLGGRVVTVGSYSHDGSYEAYGNVVRDSTTYACALDPLKRRGVYLEWWEHDNSA